MARISRQEALRRLGPEQLAEVEYQRDAIRRDVDWGIGNSSMIAKPHKYTRRHINAQRCYAGRL